MNHHLPAMPMGQPPMPPSRRQQEFTYNQGPPNMRSQPYMGYPPHMNAHMPPAYSPQQFPPWYPPYGHMQMPPRHYQPPYGPMIVSSYPQTQPIMAPNHLPPHALPMQPRTSTPLQPTMSPSIPAPPPLQPEIHDHPLLPVQQQPQQYPIPSPPPRWEPKAAPEPQPVFVAPVPWLSVPEIPFPARLQYRRRSNRLMPESVEFPPKDGVWIIGEMKGQVVKVQPPPSAVAVVSSEPQTPTSIPPSDGDSTQPTSPSSSARSQTQQKPTKPAIPIIPVVPNIPGTPRRQARDDSSTTSETPKSTIAGAPETDVDTTSANEAAVKPTSSVRAAPKSWADLVRAKAAARPSAGAATAVSPESTTIALQQNKSLADVLSSMGEDVSQYSDKIAFLEPRGLVNTGNMCYMNSILQILVSCVPFHQFLDHVGRRAAHSFHSDMPLIDAMIMFMKEFRVIDAATSEEQLRLRLKPNELEQYGEAFVPEFVYEMIRQLPRFRDMQRGHQQDAQEFLGFLLEELHEECDRAGKHAAISQTTQESTDHAITNGSSGDGWLEVGAKQKAAVTQSSGAITAESPVTRIFGGKLRSEFKVPGNKTSVTMEPYQPLQLDIGAPEVHNIVDALKGLTKPESIQGDFNSSRGPNVTATKQIFIETLPPVLILHLKRFQYDNLTGATQKIWKKVGYPLDLEIPREVFPAHQRNTLTAQGGLPKYRLMGVIYHHGKNASGGHYTVDVRRQDGREWIRMDDTVIRRVRSEDVAEAGGEEDPKVLAAALEQHKQDKNPRANIFDHIDQVELESADNEKGWSQVNGAGSTGHSSKKSVNGVAPSSGPSSGVRTPLGRYGSRDNRVAYLLFYQRIV
ncbi:hypothetical protein N7462_002672 [Penicillium macrosclerotiorum]|uniref:uncharacterized protein n=1 Tax=Penicillium macrosclerotiorum TaxID=303699 RepID=UPI002548986E|nr:uncharacterized protein N7462_002672 [Penicillium macrosclerotiorum]KAJ5693249.1 hypothetical protein N7462_002672 [Penicillium macrosclerotiorum]